MNEYPCIDCGSNDYVRPRQEALQCDQCSQWQHRLCNTGKTFLSNCIALPPNCKQKIKKCRILKALSISSVTSIIGNATTKYEEFLREKAINQSVLMK